MKLKTLNSEKNKKQNIMDKKDYKNVFVFAEQREGVIQPVALELLGKARDLADALGEKVVAMLLGEGIKDKAQMLIEFGADEVIVVDAPELKDFLSEQYSQAVGQIITGAQAQHRALWCHHHRP